MFPGRAGGQDKAIASNCLLEIAMSPLTTAASLNRAADLRRLHAAASVVRAVIPPTPQYCWPLLSQALGAAVWVKHENHTEVGAFKVRGGLTYLHALRRRAPALQGDCCDARQSRPVDRIGRTPERHDGNHRCSAR